MFDKLNKLARGRRATELYYCLKTDRVIYCRHRSYGKDEARPTCGAGAVIHKSCVEGG